MNLINKKILTTSPVYNFVVGNFKQSKIYWRYRHLIDRKCWDIPENNSSDESRFVYSELTKQYSLKYFFEFGCGSAANCKIIQENSSEDIIYLGYDISKAALRAARKSFPGENTKFFNKISREILLDSLNIYGAESFDCALFDNVLYNLSEGDLRKHLEGFSSLYRYILINDFHRPGMNLKQGKNLEYPFGTYAAYKMKDYIKLLSEFGFDLLLAQKTEESSSERYFRDNAYLLFFQNSNKISSTHS